MSLADAVLEVAEQMDDAVTWGDMDPPSLDSLVTDMLGFARQLRSAVKAATPDHVVGRIIAAKVPDQPPPVFDDTPRMVDVADGPAVAGAALCVPVHSAMPVGARMLVEGSVYELGQDGRLYYKP